MKIFVVTYRNREGQRVTESFKATSRAAVFELLKEKGIVATSIVEGAQNQSYSKRLISPLKCAFGILVIALLTGVGIFISSRGSSRESFEKIVPPTAPQKTKPQEAKVEKVIKQAAPPVIKPVTNAPGKNEIAELPPQKVGETRDGYILLPSGRKHRVRGVVTNSTAVVKSKYAIFKYPSENVIAGILMAKPGEGMVGTPHYNGRFTANFLKSLSENIEINTDDPEDIRSLKNAMIETRQVLKAAHDRGEDIEEIILNARKECQEMARYKHKLEAAMHESVNKNNNMTSKDVDDYIAAANEMLAREGIAPLKPSAIMRIKLKLNKSEN